MKVGGKWDIVLAGAGRSRERPVLPQLRGGPGLRRIHRLDHLDGVRGAVLLRLGARAVGRGPRAPNGQGRAARHRRPQTVGQDVLTQAAFRTEPYVNEDNATIDWFGTKGDDGKYYLTALPPDGRRHDADAAPAVLPEAGSGGMQTGVLTEYARAGAAGTTSTDQDDHAAPAPRTQGPSPRRCTSRSSSPSSFSCTSGSRGYTENRRERREDQVGGRQLDSAEARGRHLPGEGQGAEGPPPRGGGAAARDAAEKVVALMLEGLKRQNIIEVVQEDPLQIRVLTASKAEHEYEELFLQAFDTEGKVLSGLLSDFFEKVLQKLQEKVWDCDLEATREYYRANLEKKDETEEDRRDPYYWYWSRSPGSTSTRTCTRGCACRPSSARVTSSSCRRPRASRAASRRRRRRPAACRPATRPATTRATPRATTPATRRAIPRVTPPATPRACRGARIGGPDSSPRVTVRDLAWVDGFFREVRSHVFVRSEDGVLILPPNQVFRRTRAACASSATCCRAGRSPRLPGIADGGPRPQVHEFCSDLRDFYQGDSSGLDRASFERVPYTFDFTRLPILGEIAVTYACNNACRFCYAGLRHGGTGMRPGAAADVGRPRHDARGGEAGHRRLQARRANPLFLVYGGRTVIGEGPGGNDPAARAGGLEVNLVTNGTLAGPGTGAQPGARGPAHRAGQRRGARRGDPRLPDREPGIVRSYARGHPQPPGGGHLRADQHHGHRGERAPRAAHAGLFRSRSASGGSR